MLLTVYIDTKSFKLLQFTVRYYFKSLMIILENYMKFFLTEMFTAHLRKGSHLNNVKSKSLNCQKK